jgi:hypothetical protein
LHVAVTRGGKVTRVLLLIEAVGSSEKVTSTAGMISEQRIEKNPEGTDRRLT